MNNGDVMKMNNSAVGNTWEELEQRLFTAEEIAASNLKVALIGEHDRARKEKDISILKPLSSRKE